jgi:hypothetical protein
VAKGVLTKTRSPLGVISQRCGQDRRLSRRNAKGFQAGGSGSQEGSVPQIPALDPQDPGLARSLRPSVPPTSSRNATRPVHHFGFNAALPYRRLRVGVPSRLVVLPSSTSQPVKVL